MAAHLHYLSVEELHPLVRSQEISPVKIVDACLARIHKLNARLNAFITILEDEARAHAKRAEAEIKAGRWKGPLHGIPVGIKDFYDTGGSRTTAAFEHFKHRVPKQDAVGVAKLEAAGAIVAGKMNMHRLGMGTTGLESAFGPVRNPWNDDYIPGGSSSGSAAAVAAGLCYATLDTDAIGSCRLPAACCGVVGFKATYGLISGKGITTRSVADTALVLNVLAEPREKGASPDFHRDALNETKLRVGVADNFKADKEIVAAFNRAVEAIRAFGHDVKTTSAQHP